MSIAEDRRGAATADTPACLRRVAEVLDAHFIGRSEVIRLLIEPNEIFGPIDIAAFRQGEYRHGRAAADNGDLFILKHVWNTEDQTSNLLNAALKTGRFSGP